ncbi:MAG TPA: phage terminase small subunit [Sphingomonas sp.]|nr:phage terminase small subunit [Sphingomonas sp.]
MSLARRHQDRILAAQAASAPAAGSGLSAEMLAADRAAAQIALRLQHDLRRLKEIKALPRKIAAKREMLPEYAAWIEGLLAADQPDTGVAAEVLPTIMVWLIDVGDYPAALDLGRFILRHGVAMPARYHRDAASVLAEDIAEAAIKAQNADQPFALDILEAVEELTADIDMHDPIAAKLQKAVGVELDRAARAAAEAGTPEGALAMLLRSRTALMAAQDLQDRIGVKTVLKNVEKAIASAAHAPAVSET